MGKVAISQNQRYFCLSFDILTCIRVEKRWSCKLNYVCSLSLELRYYTCYYPESDAFRERVASIVNYFRENGYNVIMDVMVSEEITSQGPTRWGESQIRKANKVLIFLSPGLVNLALDGGAESQSQVDTFSFLLFCSRFRFAH